MIIYQVIFSTSNTKRVTIDKDKGYVAWIPLKKVDQVFNIKKIKLKNN